MQDVPELSPSEFARRWPDWREGADVTLLDVREPAELEIASVDRALHIPMNQVPARLDELDSTKSIVVMCHSGRRSRRVAEFLAARGYDRVANLSGGIDAWSQQIDPAVPRY